MNPDTLVIVNPTAGGGRARRAEPRIARFLAANGVAAKFIHSRSSEDIREQAARAAADGFRNVVALGGDGAFHHLVEGIRGTGAVAGFFPAGNGNDIARSLGIPAHPLRAAEAFLQSPPRAVDVVRVRFREGRTAHFIGVGGMGLDAEAAHLANSRFRKWPGLWRYLAGAIVTFARQSPLDMNAQWDEERWSGRALFAAVANGTGYGAGIHIAPEARMDDGMLDVALVGDLRWLRFLRAIPVVLTSGDLSRFPEVRRFRCRRVVLETGRSVKVHGDGEWLGESPAEFEVLPSEIQVKAPAPAPPRLIPESTRK
jgi:diacylglycerol kinase (ATP)